MTIQTSLSVLIKKHTELKKLKASKLKINIRNIPYTHAWPCVKNISTRTCSQNTLSILIGEQKHHASWPAIRMLSVQQHLIGWTDPEFNISQQQLYET